MPERDDVAGKPEFILESILVAGAAVLIAKFVVTEMDRRKGGCEVRLDSTPKVVRRSGNVPFGTFVIFGSDGEVTITAVDQPKDWMDRFLAEVVCSLTSAGDVAKAALEAGIAPSRVEVAS